MNRIKDIKDYVVDSVSMKEMDENLKSSTGHVWSNEDLDPVPPERRVWTAFNYGAYWIAESWGASTWSVGSSLVAGGLLWWHALLGAVVGHLFGSLLMVWNGRGGSTYHIGFPVWIRATFGPWGSLIPVLVRTILDLVWFGIQTYFGGLFLDVVFQCIFGHHWTNIPNHLPASSDTTTRSMAAYFLFWLFQFITCFFRPHQIRWLFTVKAVTMPLACFGLFIWALVRSGGPGSFALTASESSSSLLAWTFLGAVNACINGEFGPLVASEPDITRYARKPRDQIIGQLAVAPWSATLVVLLGIVSASCTQKIYGEALWNPAEILNYILLEDNSPKTKFAVLCCAFPFFIGQIGTNFAANLIPFGVDSSALAPRYINIVRGQILCALIGGWAVVPWKVLVSGTVFISCITGMGIFMGTLVGIMVGDYFFVCKGNYFVEDLYTSNPEGRYWYTGGWNWRAYTAYLAGIALPFPGFLGQLGVKSMAKPLGAAAQIYDIGYLTSFSTALVLYVALCRISPPKHVKEARSMDFEYMCNKEVLMGHVVRREGTPVEEELKMEMGGKI